MTENNTFIDRVLNASTTEELDSAYAEWADRYDSDLVDSMGYVAPMIASEILAKKLTDSSARILDAGCGTGLVGECLQQQGYSAIDGLDYSNSMLEQASQKQIYQDLSQADLTARLKIPNDSYDAIISVGTFTCGHVGPEALKELVRITKADGYICFTVRQKAWNEDDYQKQMDELENSGAWRKLQIVSADYIKNEGSSCKVCLYQVAG